MIADLVRMISGSDIPTQRDQALEQLLGRITLLLDRNDIDRVNVAAGLDAGARARLIVRHRAEIGRFFNPELFGDPAFDILLDLFASHEERRTVRTSHCAHAARIPQTTSLRWLALLEREGLIERYLDDEDHRCTLIRLTPAARASVSAYLERIASIPPCQR